MVEPATLPQQGRTCVVAALGAELVARRRTTSALDLPADSSQPITSVVV